MTSTTHQEHNIISWLKSNNILECFHSFIQREDAFTRITSGVLGWTWEEDFVKMCEGMGFSCIKSTRLDLRHDCVINGYRVQCKHTASFPYVDIRNKDKTTKRKYTIYDFDVMSIRSPDGIYLIPMEKFPNSKIENFDVIPGRIDLKLYQEFKENWECLKN